MADYFTFDDPAVSFLEASQYTPGTSSLDDPTQGVVTPISVAQSTPEMPVSSFSAPDNWLIPDPYTAESRTITSMPQTPEYNEPSPLSRLFGGLTTFVSGVAEVAPSLANAYRTIKGEPILTTARQPLQYEPYYFPTIMPQDTETKIPASPVAPISFVKAPTPAPSMSAGPGPAIGIPLIIGGIVLMVLIMKGKII